MKQIRTRRSNIQAYMPGDQIDTSHNMFEFSTVQYDWPSFDPKNQKMYLNYFWIYSIFSFLFDFGSDIYLLIVYYNQKHFVWFTLTLSFVIIPSVIITLFSLTWYWMDKTTKFSVRGWIIRLFLHIFQLGPLVRFADAIIYGWKSKHAKERKIRDLNYRLMIYEEADSALLRVMECSMESTPQLLLQLYILLIQPQVKDQKVVILQFVSSASSLISLAWCLSSYQSSLRLTNPEKKELLFSSMILMILWKLLVILPRFLAISLFVSIYNLYILIVLGFHYILMSVYIISQKTTFFSHHPFTLQEIVFDLVMGAIYCVDFLNVKEGSTRYRYSFYYLLSFIEILTLMSLWFYDPLCHQSWAHMVIEFSPGHFNGSTNATLSFYYQRWPSFIRKIVFSMTMACFILGIAVMLIYFLYFHPTQNIQIYVKKIELTPDPAIIGGDSLVVNVDNTITFSTTETKSQESTFIVPY